MFEGGHSAIVVGVEPYLIATHMYIQLRFSSSILYPQFLHAPSSATIPRVASAKQSNKTESEIPIEDRSMEIFG